jgi:uncharacterized protein
MGFRISVTVKANAKKAEVRPLDRGGYVATVKAQALAGKANRALVAALAEYFRVPNSAVRIIHGQTSRRKLIEIG